MLAVLLSYCLGLGAVLATLSMIATWLDYAADWAALGMAMRVADGAGLRYAVVCAESAEHAAALLQTSQFRATPPAFAHPHQPRRAIRAAA